MSREMDVAAWWGPRSWAQWKDEVLASVVVMFAQAPESVIFAGIAGVPPILGLHAAWMVGLICALFGGRPGMINGSAGALASVTCNYVSSAYDPTLGQTVVTGLEDLFLSVMLAGLLILVCGFFRVGRFLCLVPATVMIGFCNGLAIILSQGLLGWFQDVSGQYVQGVQLAQTLIHCAVGLVLMLGLPKITKQMPASLIVIAVGCALEYAIFRGAMDTPGTITIGDKSKFDTKDRWPIPWFANSKYDVAEIGTPKGILIQTIMLAIVAMLESLMTLEVMNELTQTLGQPNKQLWALGFANVVAGVFGTMGGNSLIELSIMNVQAKGTLRASAVISAAGVMLIVFFAFPILNLLPSGCLAAIMVVVILDTARWSSIPAMVASLLPEGWLKGESGVRTWLRALRIEPFDTLVILLVTGTTYLSNLAVATGIGTFLSTLRFAWQAQLPLKVDVEENDSAPGVRIYKLKGDLFFASKEKLAQAFDIASDPPVVQIDFARAKIFDFSVLHAFHGILAAYADKGIEVRISNLRNATHLQHLLYFGAVGTGSAHRGSGASLDQSLGKSLDKSLLSAAASWK